MFWKKKYICGNCGTQDKIKWVAKGSIFIEIILWLMFLIPGLIYSVWRQSTKQRTCKACDSTNLVPKNTPIGEKLVLQFNK